MKELKYIAYPPTDMAVVYGTGIAPPAVVRQWRDERGRRCTKFVLFYRRLWAARVAAWILSLLARWEIGEEELPDFQVKQPPLTEADLGAARRLFESIEARDSDPDFDW